ncbi:hypothetical protein BV20DRAFT_1030611 [Pilatotrama ljubarskyi]|nr:hypothetical protein BV20DRAFT_1030611 [Pilatotrama ljubarskyi]
MPSTRDADSPFDGSRFALREDSRTWPGEPGYSRKVTRFASKTSVSSDRDEEDLPPILLAKDSKRASIFLPAALAVLLLAVASAMHLSRSPYTAFLLSKSIRWPWVTSLNGSDVVLPPAMRAAIEEVVLSTVRAQQASRRGRPDYALRAHGGRIAQKLTSGPRGGILSVRDDDPSIAIDDDVHAGKCWAISTLPAQLGIRLARMLRPTHISVEHLPSEIAVDIDRAPKNITLWGVVEGTRNKELFASLEPAVFSGSERRSPTIAREQLWAPLVSFAYDIHADDPVQTFPVSQYAVHGALSFGVVAVEILGNWGGNTTCLYRVRIHGEPI